jgi:hypothetical protein
MSSKKGSGICLYSRRQRRQRGLFIARAWQASTAMKYPRLSHQRLVSEVCSCSMHAPLCHPVPMEVHFFFNSLSEKKPRSVHDPFQAGTFFCDRFRGNE